MEPSVSATKTRIMYIECKGASLQGPSRIGRVTYSKSGRSLTYAGRTLLASEGFKSNYIDVDRDEEYWVSGPRRRGSDRLYGTGIVEIDEDVRVEYWTEIRGMPSSTSRAHYGP